jgi:hypothetical protein
MIFVSNLYFAQDCSRILVKGKAVDSLSSIPFINFILLNHTTGQAFFGKPDGSFGVYVNANDSLVFSARGYLKAGFRAKSDSNCTMIKNIELEAKSTEIAGVVVKPIKSIQQIREEREKMAERQANEISGLNVLQSPVTALYERFSKEGKSKNKAFALEYEDVKLELQKDLLRTYVSFDIVELTTEEFEEFILFMNIDENYLKTASDWELVAMIKEKFAQYKLYKKSDK